MALSLVCFRANVACIFYVYIYTHTLGLLALGLSLHLSSYCFNTLVLILEKLACMSYPELNKRDFSL